MKEHQRRPNVISAYKSSSLSLGENILFHKPEDLVVVKDPEHTSIIMIKFEIRIWLPRLIHTEKAMCNQAKPMCKQVQQMCEQVKHNQWGYDHFSGDLVSLKESLLLVKELHR